LYAIAVRKFEMSLSKENTVDQTRFVPDVYKIFRHLRPSAQMQVPEDAK